MDKSNPMKYLFLIIRHIFPRRRWRIVRELNYLKPNGGVCGKMYVLQDQFGNIKKRSYFSES